MNYLIKRCSHSDIKNKMVAIYILNVTDMIFTLLLCGTGYFMEVNPLVATFSSNSLVSLLTKAVIPALLFIYLYIRMKPATSAQLKKANALIVAMLFLYAVINVSHIVWLSVYTLNPALLAVG